MDLTGFTSLQARVDLHVVLCELPCQKDREKSWPHNAFFASSSVLFERSTRGPDAAALTAYAI